MDFPRSGLVLSSSFPDWLVRLRPTNRTALAVRSNNPSCPNPALPLNSPELDSTDLNSFKIWRANLSRFQCGRLFPPISVVLFSSPINDYYFRSLGSLLDCILTRILPPTLPPSPFFCWGERCGKSEIPFFLLCPFYFSSRDSSLVPHSLPPSAPRTRTLPLSGDPSIFIMCQPPRRMLHQIPLHTSPSVSYSSATVRRLGPTDVTSLPHPSLFQHPSLPPSPEAPLHLRVLQYNIRSDGFSLISIFSPETIIFPTWGETFYFLPCSGILL
jgi:hypothetical protein